MTALSKNELAKLERFAELEGQLAELEEVRSAELADVHLRIDRETAPLRTARDKIASELQAWWDKRRAELLPAGRKSVVVAGVELGSRANRATLLVQGDENAVVEALGALRWAKPFLRSKVSIDRTAVLKALDGTRGPAFAELGFAKGGGDEEFFVRRAAQEGLVK